MRAVVSEIARRYEPICADLFLEAEVPLGDLRVWSVVIVDVHERGSRPWRVTANLASVWQWEWISTGIVCPWIFEIHIGQTEPREIWWCGGQVLVIRGRKIVKRSRRSANGRMAIPGHIPCQPQTGRNISPLRVLALRERESGIPGKENTRRRRIELVAFGAFVELDNGIEALVHCY